MACQAQPGKEACRPPALATSESPSLTSPVASKFSEESRGWFEHSVLELEPFTLLPSKLEACRRMAMRR